MELKAGIPRRTWGRSLTVNPFNGIESKLSGRIISGAKVENPFNGIESRTHNYTQNPKLSVRNPFNGIESAASSERVSTTLPARNPFNGIESL